MVAAAGRHDIPDSLRPKPRILHPIDVGVGSGAPSPDVHIAVRVEVRAIEVAVKEGMPLARMGVEVVELELEEDLDAREGAHVAAFPNLPLPFAFPFLILVQIEGHIGPCVGFWGRPEVEVKVELGVLLLGVWVSRFLVFFRIPFSAYTESRGR